MDQVAFLHTAAINQEVAKEAEELKLVAGQRGMLGDELVN